MAGSNNNVERVLLSSGDFIKSMKGGEFMEDYQQRVIEERSDLLLKLSALRAFLVGDIFKALPVDEQERLNLQAEIMQAYANVLMDRIDHF